MTNIIIETFIKENTNNAQLVAVYEFNIDNKLYYKTFKFNNAGQFIKNCINIIDVNVKLPKLYLSNKYQVYDAIEIERIYNFVKNIYYLRYKLKQMNYNNFHKNIKF